MWEVVVLHGLSIQGHLRHEVPLPSGKRPDVNFENEEIRFVADIAAVSDEGLDDKNPYKELSNLLEEAKSRLGLPFGGTNIDVGSKNVVTSRGVRVDLMLPHRRRLRDFVREKVEPQLWEQLNAGEKVLKIQVSNESEHLQIQIDTRGPQFSYGSYAAYDAPTIKDKNPLYNALQSKARQLRGATGVVGVVVGDAGSGAFVRQRNDPYAITSRDIADEFLRQYSSIHFVLLLSIMEDHSKWYVHDKAARNLTVDLVCREEEPSVEFLEKLFRKMCSETPKPVMSPRNAAYRVRQEGYSLGYHGGGSMSRKRIKISSRELMELLSGRIGIEKFNNLHEWSNPFELRLREGRLPKSISVVQSDDDAADDWIEFEFGDPDPAISPFR